MCLPLWKKSIRSLFQHMVWMRINSVEAIIVIISVIYLRLKRATAHCRIIKTSFWPATYTIILLSSSTFWNTYICTPALFSLGHGASLNHIIIHTHSYGYICIHMHAYACPLLHPDWLCMHMYASVSTCSAYTCRCVYMHTHWGPTRCIPSIGMYACGCTVTLGIYRWMSVCSKNGHTNEFLFTKAR